MKRHLVSFLVALQAVAQTPSPNFTQKFFTAPMNDAATVTYNSGCVNLSGSYCSQDLQAGMQVTHAMGGDSFLSCWADDGAIYSHIDDNYAVNYTTANSGNNLSVIKITGSPFDGSWVLSNVNSMSDYGLAVQQNTNGWSDGRNWKTTGLYCRTVGGTHYQVAWVCRQEDLTYTELSCSVVQTADYWAHTTNAFGTTNTTGAAPVSPNAWITTAVLNGGAFVDFGQQNGACPASAVDDCNNYIYWTSTGYWTNYTSSNKLYLGRVPVADIANLTNWFSDMQWYNSAHSGCPGIGNPGNASCWDATQANATAIFTSALPYLGTFAPMVWVPSSGKYFMIHYAYPTASASNSALTVLECTTVAGPCSNNIQPTMWNPQGYYNLQIISKWSDFTSRNLAVIFSGNYGTASGTGSAPLSTLYTIHANYLQLPPPVKTPPITRLSRHKGIPGNGLTLLYNPIRDVTSYGMVDYSGGGNSIAIPVGSAFYPVWSGAGLAFAGADTTSVITTALDVPYSAVTAGGLFVSSGPGPGGGYDRLIDSYTNTTNGFWMGRSASTANLFTWAFKQSAAPFGATFSLTDGISHLVLGTWNGTAQGIYISGTAGTLASGAPGSGAAQNVPLSIGNSTGGGNSGLLGTIYTLPLWSRALSLHDLYSTYLAIKDMSVSVGVTP